MAGKTRGVRKSPLTDNVRPGSPTTMDVLLEWLTTPGNVKRWRTETRGPLVRELVENMQEAGLAHRNAPFVRYKVDALEKHYLTAKQWLLETGMHDSFMRGKASKDIKAQVDKVCPQFLTLDPAFKGVPFSSKNAETIELDGDSAEDVETEKKGAESEEVEDLDEVEESGEEEEDGSGSSEEDKEKEKSDAPKRNTFRDRLVAAVVEKEKPTEANKAPLTESKEKKPEAKKAPLTESKEKKPEPKEPKKKASTNEPKKKASTAKEPVLTSAVKVALAQTVEAVKPKAPTKPHSKTSTREKKRASLTKQEAELAPAPAKSAAESSPAPAAKRRGRPPKSATVAAAKTNGAKETEPKASEEVASHATKVAKRKHPNEEEAVKRARTREADEAIRTEVREIERKALLKRVQDEQTQRHEMFGIERAKMQCELEAKQVHVLFEKAAARKKLDQLGISQEEIDRIIPL